MPPAPVRTPNKRTIAALPETSRLSFLLAASQLLADSVPQASGHLGCQALKWADTKQLPLPRGSVAQLCRICGTHCNSKDAVLVRSSYAQRHRKLQPTQTHTQNRHSEQKISAVSPCQVCGGNYVRSFVNIDAAHKAFPKAALVPTVRAAAPDPAGKSSLAAAPGLGLAASSKAHQPATVLQSCSEVRYSHQEATECADANVAEPQVARTAPESILQQPHQVDDGPSALDRASQLASSGLSVDKELKLTSVLSTVPSSNVPPAQDANLSMQQDLTVNRAANSQKALHKLSDQHAETVGDLSHASQMEKHQASGYQTAQPIHMRDLAGQQLHNTDTDSVQVADASKPQTATIPEEQEFFAIGALQSGADIAFSAGEVQSDSSPASAGASAMPSRVLPSRVLPSRVLPSRVLQVSALRKRRPFSWRKHGRSWRYMRSKQLVV